MPCSASLFKNYYNITITVENSINTEIHKGFQHTAGKIEEIPDIHFSILYNFYWDSCNKNTIITYDYIYDDPFFDQLINEEVSQSEKMQVCINVEKYLKKQQKA